MTIGNKKQQEPNAKQGHHTARKLIITHRVEKYPEGQYKTKVANQLIEKKVPLQKQESVEQKYISIFKNLDKKWIFTAISLAGIILAFIYISSANPKPPIAQPITSPPEIPFSSYIGASGITEANTENIAIGTYIAGIVSAVYVKQGDLVRKGDPLFLIEDREAKANLAQSRANLDDFIAQLHNAQDQYATIKNITDKRAVSNDERNQKLHALEAAQAKLETAKSAVDAQKTELELHTVRAPVSGTVMTTNIRQGEYASTGVLNEPLIRFGNLNPMRLRIDIDENDAWRFINASKAIAFVRGNPQIKTALEFIRVDPYVRPKISLTGAPVERVDTRVLQVIYSFDPSNLPIYVGQQMDVYIEAPEIPPPPANKTKQEKKHDS